MKRWRSAAIALLVLAMVGSLLALAVPPSSVAGAQEPSGETTTSVLNMDCIGEAIGVRQPETAALPFNAIAPANVEPDSVFTVRLAPQQGFFPYEKDSIIGKVRVFHLEDIRLMYNFPTNASVESVSIVPGSGFGFEGTPTVSINTTDYSPGRIVLYTPLIPGNPVEPSKDTFFQYPALDVTMRATGAEGSTIVTRVAGTSEATSGYVFQASSTALADVECWPTGEVAAPAMHTTLIGSSSSVVPTTTTLSANPTLTVGSQPVTLTAQVDTSNEPAFNGVVRFSDGATTLGYGEVSGEGVATLTTSLSMGQRTITASYLGSQFFEASSSNPVSVFVVNPTNRAPTRITIDNPPIISNGQAFDLSVTVSRIGAGPSNPSNPTGLVNLYSNDVLVATRPLANPATPPAGRGIAVFNVNISPQTRWVQPDGNVIRAEYVGDAYYLPSAGGTSVSSLSPTFNDPNENVLNLALTTGELTLNQVAGTLPEGDVLFPFGVPPTGSLMQSSFGTITADGAQTLGGFAQGLQNPNASKPQGAFVTPGQIVLSDLSGHTVTASLAQFGQGEGSIQPGNDAMVSYETKLALLVQSANLGAGNQTFAADCVLGPWEVTLTGTRALDTGGDIELSASGFTVPLPSSGSCRNNAGVSQAAGVAGVLSGGFTELSFTLEDTPGVAAATQVSPVSYWEQSPPNMDPMTEAYFGQTFNVRSTVSRVDGQPLPGDNIYGQIDFLYSTGTFLSSQNLLFTDEAQSNVPYPGLALQPPIGEHEFYSVFYPSLSGSRVVRPSPSGALSAFEILTPPTPTIPTLTLSVPETAQAGEPVTLDIQLTPAPNETSDPPLTGRVSVLDENGRKIRLTGTFGGDFFVDEFSDGHLTGQTALPPGVHQLKAVFTPVDFASFTEGSWYWGPAESGVETHTVVGSQIPTELRIVGDSTRGTGKVQQGTALMVEVELSPKIASNNIFAPTAFTLTNAEAGTYNTATFNTSGKASIVVPATTQLGQHQATIEFSSSKFIFSGGNPATDALSNGGFASSSVTIDYEVVRPGTVAEPFPTGSVITAVGSNPVAQGTRWSSVTGYVSFNATSNPNTGAGMRYTAYNASTGEPTFLGSVQPNLGTNVSNGFSRAQISGTSVTTGVSAATASLPAGAYDVIGEFVPTPGTGFLGSTSAPFRVNVVAPGGQIGTSTNLTVLPGETSLPGNPVILEASVAPVSAGSMEFFDGETSLGTASVNGGVGSLMTFDLAEGDHDLRAVFTPSSVLVTGSESQVVAHTVADPTVPTTTVLTKTPEGTTYDGQDVTFTATVSPAEAAGTVSFDSDGDLGEAPVVNGVATLVVDDLTVGTHEVIATFLPTDGVHGESVSNEVSHTVETAPVGPIETGTTLAIDPEGSATVGSQITLTATITPSSAVGTVSFLDGANTIAGPVPVTGGGAEVVIDDLSVGNHSLVAAFTPSDPEDYEGSASPAQAYEINTDFADPVFACQGTDPISIGLMEGVVAPPDGILYMPTTLEATVPATLNSGGSGNVSFTWSVTLPENLADLAIAAEADQIFMEDMTIAMEATGGSSETWAFPATHTITDPTAPITLQTSGTVTASSVEDILYSMRSPLLITIHVPPTPLVSVDVYVNLSCTVANATQAVTEVQGGATAPGAPTGVTATGGPLQANVSWTPPANDGGSPITGYVVTASPGGKVVHTSSNVTSIDVIGLTAGQSYTFVVQAINEVGTGTASMASNSVEVTAGEDFSDVPTDHAFYSEIEWLSATGITQGFGDNTFRPENTLNRQGMAAFLYRLSGNPDGVDPTCDTAPFTDVPTTNEFCGEIQWLKDEGITQGTGDTFNPGGPLNRQAMSAYLYRLANGPATPPACTTSLFPDVPTSNLFCPQITWMAEMDITQTPPGANFRPGDALKRQAMASFLYRYSLVVPTGL